MKIIGYKYNFEIFLFLKLKLDKLNLNSILDPIQLIYIAHLRNAK